MKILFLAYTSKSYNGGGIKIDRADLTRKMSCLETWVPRIKKLGHEVIFFDGSNEVQSYDEKNSTLHLVANESYDYDYLKDQNIGSLMLVRLQEVLRWALANREFDYVFRVDDGTYVNAFVIEDIYEILRQGHSVVRSGDGGGGAGMFFSREVCKQLVQFTNPKKIHIEDMAIWDFLVTSKIESHFTNKLCHQYILSENLFTIHYTNGKRMYFTDNVISYYHQGSPIKRKVIVNHILDGRTPMPVNSWSYDDGNTPIFYSFDKDDNNWEYYGRTARSSYTVEGVCLFAPRSIDTLLLCDINFDFNNPSQYKTFFDYVESVTENGCIYFFYTDTIYNENDIKNNLQWEIVDGIKGLDPELKGTIFKVKGRKRIVVAQYWTPNLTYGKYTKAINKKYCLEKNYIYHVETDELVIDAGREGRAHTWWKPRFLLEVLEKYNPSHIMFLDADAVVNDSSFTIEQFLDDNYDIIAAHDHGPSKINAGVIIIKNTEWVKEFLRKWWGFGYTHPEYNHSFWWDQTGFGMVMDSWAEAESKIKIISNRLLNWREHSQDNFIFHAFGYGGHRFRTIDAVYKKVFKKEAVKRTNPKTFVVYHCYLIKKWKELVTEQLTRLKTSGLCDAADKIYCIAIDVNQQRNQYIELVNSIIGDKAEIQVHTDNAQEFYAITKVWQLGQTEDCNIFYFHTKGVYNDFVTPGSNEVNEFKVKTFRDWRLHLEYFCIDKWKENIEKLETVDQVGATNNNKWWWGNFWWVNSNYLRDANPPVRSGSRWDYEAWINDGSAKIYEHNHISFTACFTDYPEHFYKDGMYEKYAASPITIHSAFYGNDGKPMDEGWGYPNEPKLNDVTDIVRNNVANNNGMLIDIRATNTIMNGDPCFGIKKGLYVKYSFDIEPDVIYNVFCAEDSTLKFPTFRNK